MRIEEAIQQKQFQSEHQKLLVNLLYTASWVMTTHSRQLRPHGITPQQYNILRILRGQYPNAATVTTLKSRMFDKMSNVSRLVEKLRVKGLLERRRSSTDRRSVNVKITDDGLNLLEQLDHEEATWYKELIPISQERAREINELLDDLRDPLTTHSTDLV